MGESGGPVAPAWRIGVWVSLLIAWGWTTTPSYAEPATATVGKLRSEADAALATGQFEKGVKLYSQVIHKEPDNENNYFKRYRAYLRSRKYKDAYSDLSTALRINAKFTAALKKRVELGLQIGRCFEAVGDLSRLKSIDATAPELRHEDAVQQCAQFLQSAADFEQRSDWRNARNSLASALQYADSSHDLLLHRAHSSLNLGDFFEAVADSGRAIKIESDSIAALEIRGRAYYHLGEHEHALNHWRQALKFDPEHKSVKGHYRTVKKLEKLRKSAEANEASGQLEAAIKDWRAAIAVDDTHHAFAAPALIKISKALTRLKRWDDAIRAAEDASKRHHEDSRMDAQLTVAEALLGAERYDECVRAYQQAVEMDAKDPRANDGLRKAKVALKQSKEVDYYKVLGVSRTASGKEIKKAYKEKALKNHPDKVAAEDRDHAEQEFMKIAQAYEILSDEETRRKYDRGEDVTGQGGAGGGPHGGPGGFQFHHPQNMRHGGFTFHFR
mmetsp:Transcript_887/g.2877  ORF Transcript_887/g.2877 Transcript_887/m.2877 type:complete len:500 (-) Transcript_887:260-1759(-)